MSVGRPDYPHRLGKQPAEPGGILFSLSNYVNLELPSPPPHFRHPHPPRWEDYDNSKYGNCVFAGACHETLLWEHEGGYPDAPFTTETVLQEYSTVSGFVRGDPTTDRGSSVTRAAAYRRQTGIIDAEGKRHKIDAYAKLRLRSMSYLRSALWVLGAVGLGFQFPDYAMKQFSAGEPWEVKKSLWGSIVGDEITGGHYVAAIGIAPNGNIICVSWGREQEMTPEFYLKFADECVAYLDLDRLNQTTKLSPEGFNEERLRKDLYAVSTGQMWALNESPTQWA
jgi:hypothetical protein